VLHFTKDAEICSNNRRFFLFIWTCLLWLSLKAAFLENTSEHKKRSLDLCSCSILPLLDLALCYTLVSVSFQCFVKDSILSVSMYSVSFKLRKYETKMFKVSSHILWYVGLPHICIYTLGKLIILNNFSI
jgi:hypothetical protein